MKYTGSKFTISAIIPCYGEPSIVKNSILALAQQWIPMNPFCGNGEIVAFNLEILLVNDDVKHPDKYSELVELANKIKTGDMVTIKVIVNEKNTGQGLARQYGIDNCTGQFFITCDEDDVYAPNAIYRMWEALFKNYYIIENGNEIILKNDAQDLAIVAAPLYGFDVNDYRQNIQSNSIWVNSSLYNKEFLERYNIRYIEPTSRHGEDYTYIKMFNFAYNHCTDKVWGRIDFDQNSPTFYYWYPNPRSQSRSDEFYSQRISGSTMRGSCEIIKYMRDFTKPEEYSEQYKEEEKHELLNMNIYCFFNILDFIMNVASRSFAPTEEEWITLRDASQWLRTELVKVYDEIVPCDIYDEFYRVHHMSDVHFVEPWIDFSDYIHNGFEFLNMNYDEMMEKAKSMDFDQAGHYKFAPYVVEWRKNRGILEGEY